MKKTNVIIAKILTCILTIGILASLFPTQITSASVNPTLKTGVLYEDDNLKVTQTDFSRTVLDKKTSKTAIINFTDSTHSNGIYKDATGNIKKYSKDNNGNVYLDGNCVVKATNSIEKDKNSKILARSNRRYYNPNYFIGKHGYKYYYVTTYTYNTRTAGDATNIALGVLAFLPHLGGLFGVASIIETARSFGAPNLYVVQKVYCTSDYSNYAYSNYFYRDSRHSKLIKSNVIYKKMW